MLVIKHLAVSRSVVHSHSGEADGRSYCQRLTDFCRKTHDRVTKYTPSDPVLRQRNQVHSLNTLIILSHSLR